MRNRAFAQYTEYANVVDQIPKPFTPELLKSGVANALQMGSMVVQAQRTGCAMPEAVGEVHEAMLEGTDGTVLLCSGARLPEQPPADGPADARARQGPHPIRARRGPDAGGLLADDRPRASEKPLPVELADLGPLLALTLGEHQDASMAGLVKMLETSLSDPRRLRALLRFQAAVLTYLAKVGEPGKFAFEP